MKRKLNGKIKSVTVRPEAGLWSASFATESEVESPVHPLLGEVVGFDFGVKQWAALADAPSTTAPMPFKRYEQRLTLLQQRLARKTKFSRNWFKAKPP